MPTESAQRFRAILVVLATTGMIVFNWMAATGFVNETTPKMISDRHITLLTPADYAFSIWGMIYAGLVAFSIYQLSTFSLGRLARVRTLYIVSCVLNCIWIYFWLNHAVIIGPLIIVLLWSVLLWTLHAANPRNSIGDTWFIKAPFGFYAGWVTAAGLVSLAVAAEQVGIELSGTGGIILIVIGAVIGVVVQITMRNYFFPLAIAWALTAIAVKQSGRTAIVVSAAVGVVACLISALSFVIRLNDQSDA